ncbi:MAG: hypothetical protein IJV50_01150 [Lachnospiraceae bacterium]|nr:hypothetical protein [Lachnospiraceae bacterium]
MKVYDYLIQNYKANEPVFLAEIEIDGISKVSVRQQMKKLTEAGKLKRFDTGIYFIPGKTIFCSGSQISREEVLKRKYLEIKGDCIGYMSGVMFANQIGVTTQVPMVYEVTTNKATKDYRETMLADTKVILRKPRIPVTKENYKILQFLDLMKDIDICAELSGQALTNRLIVYMNKANIAFTDMEEYLPYYPDKVYKNMYQVRLLSGISA